MVRSVLPYRSVKDQAMKHPAQDNQNYQPPFYRLPHISTRSAFKRVLDTVGALVGLGILAVIFVPIAIAIRLDSQGPILYSQERFGLQGKPFTIWKFRSMVTDADELKASIANESQGLIFKNEADPRITKVGRFLRKTSLDEFPQFWNVLLGDMSLVGTRPPTGDEVAHYNERHWKRLDVRPGMTGQWQVNGRSSVKDFEDIVTLDLDYQQQWTPVYDVQLLVKTVAVLLSKKAGAC